MHIHQQWPVSENNYYLFFRKATKCLLAPKRLYRIYQYSFAYHSILFYSPDDKTGAFSRFLPTLPYPFIGGDNSPPIGPHTHSPPTPITLTSLGNGTRMPLGRDGRDPIDYMNVAPTVLRPQPHLPPTALTAGGHLTNGAPANLSPLRIRVSSPNRINSDLSSVSLSP